MNLTEKYRPKTLDEFIGDVEKFREAKKYIESNFPVILCGNPGSGKTSAAFAIANELGYSVSETNMSDARKTADLEEIGNSLKRDTMIPTLFLLDEIDGISNQKQLKKILKETRSPVIMTANDNLKIDMTLKKYCKFIKIYSPKSGEIVKLIKEISKKEGIKEVSYEHINRDVRSSINSAFNASKNYDEEINDFELVNKAFKENERSMIDPIWLLDNVHEYYHGMDVYDTITKIRYMLETGDSVFIETFNRTRSGKPKYPNFLRRSR